MRKVLGGLVLALSIVGVAWAQQAPPVAAPKDELVEAWLEAVKISQKFASTECQRLESTKELNNLRQVTQLKIEGRLPGYTVDWSRLVIVAKPAPAAGK